MRKGAQTGNFLHDIFEHIDFTSQEKWVYSIRAALNRYPGTGVKLDEHQEMIKQLLEQVTGTSLPTAAGEPFCLNSIPRASRLNELEFDLPLSSIDWKNVPQYLDAKKIPIRINRESNITGGILNGKVDLFFEKDGRYYILDWKSNHLGNRAEDYHADAMAAAMEDNNYHLQYYLYCLALYRYLQTRISGFDYEKQFGGVYYLFVRGMRKDNASGIYFHKPLLEDLLMLENAMLKKPA
jgi:exodeoxyribonuclease V beta subunit